MVEETVGGLWLNVYGVCLDNLRDPDTSRRDTSVADMPGSDPDGSEPDTALSATRSRR